MKRVLTLILLLIYNSCFANNTIVAIVNYEPITLNSLSVKLNNTIPYTEKVSLINERIDIVLQLQKARELNIEASPSDINLELVNIAKKNNISIDQLLTYPEFQTLNKNISEKISILNLQRFITKNISTPNNKISKTCLNKGKKNLKQIKVAQIIISELNDNEIDANVKNDLIKSFLMKLAAHIKKGASFEALAKMHSQHPSYKNGGSTDWMNVSGPILIMLDSLKYNEVSEIYLTDYGFTIAIKLEERFVSSSLDKCKKELIYLNAQNFYFNWVKELQDDAYIKIYNE